MKIIINADDFGLSHEVNLAIVEAFKKGYITNTTIMSNMPGFDEAIELSKKNGFFDKVGIHFNVFEGVPLTEKIKRSPLFMENGHLTSRKFFHQSKSYEKLPPPFSSKETCIAIREEAISQIKRYQEAGFTEMHFDSHGHSHTFPIVWSAIAPVVKEAGFKSVRKSLNLPQGNPLRIIYKSIYNNYLICDYNRTKYFTSGTGLFLSKELLSGSEEWIEIMVHPVYDAETGELRNLGNHPNLQEILDVANELGDLYSYRDL